MNDLTTSIVGIDFPNEDKSKSNRRMECMICAPGDVVELRLEPTNPYDDNAVAIFSERGVQLGYVSAERAPLINARPIDQHPPSAAKTFRISGRKVRSMPILPSGDQRPVAAHRSGY